MHVHCALALNESPVQVSAPVLFFDVGIHHKAYQIILQLSPIACSIYAYLHRFCTSPLMGPKGKNSQNHLQDTNFKCVIITNSLSPTHNITKTNIILTIWPLCTVLKSKETLHVVLGVNHHFSVLSSTYSCTCTQMPAH